MALDLGEFLGDIRANLGGRISQAFELIQDAVNQGARAAGVDATQHVEPTTAPNAINVAAGSDQVHVTIADSTPRTRAHNYFVEWSANDPSFLSPHVEHLGAGRGRVLPLPAKNANGDQYSYYFRGYSQTLSAKRASAKIVFGGNVSPTAVKLSGESALDLLPSTGAGTAPTNGQRGGQGFGNDQVTIK